MKTHRKSVLVAAVAALAISSSAMATTAASEDFSALQGIDAEVLAVAEMDAIHGAIDFNGVLAAIQSSTKLTAQQKQFLTSYLTKLYANPLLKNGIDKILAYITAKYGI